MNPVHGMAFGGKGVEYLTQIEDVHIRLDQQNLGEQRPSGSQGLQNLPRHLPGHPTIVVKNMEGVGSVKAANFLSGQAPRDGSTLGVVTQSLALQQVLKHKAVQYDARKFGYIGRLTDAAEVTIVWHTVPVSTIADARKREVILGATRDIRRRRG